MKIGQLLVQQQEQQQERTTDMTNWLRVALLVALAAIGISIYQLFFSLQPVGFEKTQFSLQGLGNSTIVFARDDNGVIHFWADDDVCSSPH